MADDLVMRSVYLPTREDNELRQLAHELKVSKSDLIRSAIIVKLRDWHEDRSRKIVREDLQHGRRDAGKQPLPDKQPIPDKQMIKDWFESQDAASAVEDPERGQGDAVTSHDVDRPRIRAQ